MLTHLTERDEPLLTFVPQHKADTPETLKQRKPANAVKLRVVAQHERQSVTGDSTAQMMDVMNPNIGREPTQQAWQGVVRAAVKRRVLQIPNSVASPCGILELVPAPHPRVERTPHDWLRSATGKSFLDVPEMRNRNGRYSNHTNFVRRGIRGTLARM